MSELQRVGGGPRALELGTHACCGTAVVAKNAVGWGEAVALIGFVCAVECLAVCSLVSAVSAAHPTVAASASAGQPCVVVAGLFAARSLAAAVPARVLMAAPLATC